MAFPTVSAADTSSGSFTSNTTAWTVQYPANVATNDLLIFFFGIDGSGDINNAPDGFSGYTTGSDGSQRGRSMYKIATGAHSGNIGFTTSASEQGVWRGIRIQASTWRYDLGLLSATGAATPSTGSGTGPDPPSLNPTGWDVEDTLWIAFSASDHGNTTYTGFPTGFTQEDHSTAGGHAQESGGAGGAALGVAYRQEAVASLDPTAFTTDAAEGYAVVTMAIRGTTSVRTPRYGFVNYQDPGVFMKARDAWERRRGILVPKLWTPEGATI